MSSIAKFCAVTLRASSNKFGIELKSAHAHELVAAIFGYKSKASMLADVDSQIDNIARAQYFIQTSLEFLDDRRQCLTQLLLNRSDIFLLCGEMLEKLVIETGASFRFFESWALLSEILTTEYLCEHGESILPADWGHNEKAGNIFNKPLYYFKPKIEHINNITKVKVSNRYQSSSDLHFQQLDLEITITLHRVAGYVGYEDSKISIVNTSNQTAESEV